MERNLGFLISSLTDHIKEDKVQKMMVESSSILTIIMMVVLITTAKEITPLSP